MLGRLGLHSMARSRGIEWVSLYLLSHVPATASGPKLKALSYTQASSNSARARGRE